MLRVKIMFIRVSVLLAYSLRIVSEIVFDSTRGVQPGGTVLLFVFTLEDLLCTFSAHISDLFRIN